MEKNLAFIDPEYIKKERAKASRLRKTQWWKKKCQNGLCRYCNKKGPPQDLTMDHRIPLSKGGKSDKENLIPCCKNCNNQKKDHLSMYSAGHSEKII